MNRFENPFKLFAGICLFSLFIAGCGVQVRVTPSPDVIDPDLTGIWIVHGGDYDTDTVQAIRVDYDHISYCKVTPYCSQSHCIDRIVEFKSPSNIIGSHVSVMHSWDAPSSSKTFSYDSFQDALVDWDNNQAYSYANSYDRYRINQKGCPF